MPNAKFRLRKNGQLIVVPNDNYFYILVVNKELNKIIRRIQWRLPLAQRTKLYGPTIFDVNTSWYSLAVEFRNKEILKGILSE